MSTEPAATPGAAVPQVPDWSSPTLQADQRAVYKHQAPAHRAESVPGWRCRCGAATPASTSGGAALVSWHDPVLERDVLADPATPEETLTAHAGTDDASWQALLARPTHGPALTDWLVGRAQAPADRISERALRWTTLLGSRVPLTAPDLRRLTLGDGPPTLDAALALLAHPAATIDTVCAVLAAVSNHWGGPRFSEQWVRVMQEQLLERLRQDGRAWVSVPARIRAQGLRAWADFPWPERQGDLRLAHTARAERAFADGMARIGGYGDPGWRVVSDVLSNHAVRGTGYGDLVGAVLDAPPAAREP